VEGEREAGRSRPLKRACEAPHLPALLFSIRVLTRCVMTVAHLPGESGVRSGPRAGQQDGDIIGYSFLFLPEQTVNLAKVISGKCSNGCKVRLAVANPDCRHTRERDKLEGLNGTLPARIRTTLTHLQSVRTIPSFQVRYHETHLYSAVYRFDDEMLVTPYLVKAHGFEHPALHLRRLSPYGIFATYADHFDSLWSTTKAINRDTN
jgi:Domain of unknown function (DUF5919)